jgi:threonine dehydratase
MSTNTDSSACTLARIQAAHARIQDKIHRTPVLTSETLSTRAGASLFFKCENLQKIGAFKARGATNAVFSLSDEAAKRGVATHSSGNHAAAVARAAKLRGIPAYIVMPDNSPKAKADSVRRQGGQVELCEPTIQAREAGAARIVEKTGAVFVHPYDNDDVIAGQGTVTLELLEEIPSLDVILCPVGGGGLISGTAIAAKGLKPGTRVIGVEPAGADDAYRSFKSGQLQAVPQPSTIADGLRGKLSERTFRLIQAHVDDIVTVSEASIIQAMRTLWEVMKIIVEPSGAVAYAALVEGKVEAKGQSVGLIVTGGNLDLDDLPWTKG